MEYKNRNGDEDEIANSISRIERHSVKDCSASLSEKALLQISDYEFFNLLHSDPSFWPMKAQKMHAHLCYDIFKAASKHDSTNVENQKYLYYLLRSLARVANAGSKELTFDAIEDISGVIDDDSFYDYDYSIMQILTEIMNPGIVDSPLVVRTSEKALIEMHEQDNEWRLVTVRYICKYIEVQENICYDLLTEAFALIEEHSDSMLLQSTYVVYALDLGTVLLSHENLRNASSDMIHMITDICSKLLANYTLGELKDTIFDSVVQFLISFCTYNEYIELSFIDQITKQIVLSLSTEKLQNTLEIIDVMICSEKDDFIKVIEEMVPLLKDSYSAELDFASKQALMKTLILLFIHRTELTVDFIVEMYEELFLFLITMPLELILKFTESYLDFQKEKEIYKEEPDYINLFIENIDTLEELNDECETITKIRNVCDILESLLADEDDGD